MKRLITVALIIISFINIKAQSFKETFDSNSLEWTECAYESNNGTAIIDKGVMTIKSKGEKKAAGAFLTAMTGVATQVGNDTFFETHCYAPLDVNQPFKIISRVTIDKLGNDQAVGFIFNYRDGGNFYCFSFNDEMVSFIRYVDNMVVGNISQSVRWDKKKKTEQEWTLTSENGVLSFNVDGVPILKVRYMPLEYTGVGFYTFGKQKLVVDDVEFIQL